jgi:hypothetical protein
MDGIRHQDPQIGALTCRLNENGMVDRHDSQPIRMLNEPRMDVDQIVPSEFKRLDQQFGQAELARYRVDIATIDGLEQRSNERLFRLVASTE